MFVFGFDGVVGVVVEGFLFFVVVVECLLGCLYFGEVECG